MDAPLASKGKGETREAMLTTKKIWERAGDCGLFGTNNTRRTRRNWRYHY